MDVNFGANAIPATEVAAEVTPVPTAPTPTAQVPATIPTAGNLVLGDKLPDFSEIVIPRINLIANIGELSKQFEPGSIVFGQQLPIFIPPKIVNGAITRASTAPVILTVLGFKPTRYVEKVKGGGKGMIVRTEAEVTAAGGTLDYGEWKAKEASGMKRFEPLADAVVAVRRPDIAADDGSIFVYDVTEPDGSVAKYALAIWGLHGTSYTEAAKKTFFTARQMGCLRKGGYPSFSYAVSTREKPFAQTGNSAWIPVCVVNKPSTPAFLEFVKSILGA